MLEFVRLTVRSFNLTLLHHGQQYYEKGLGGGVSYMRFKVFLCLPRLWIFPFHSGIFHRGFSWAVVYSGE